jgi:hypothetical protein
MRVGRVDCSGASTGSRPASQRERQWMLHRRRLALDLPLQADAQPGRWQQFRRITVPLMRAIPHSGLVGRHVGSRSSLWTEFRHVGR